MDRLKSRKLIGTIILSLLWLLDGTSVIQVDKAALENMRNLWMVWMGVEGAVDVTRTIRQQPPPEPPPGAPEATP